jgi:hypothetical protein
MTDLAQHITEIARFFWGPENRALSSRSELRWGSKGSRSVKLQTAQWYEQGIGGGVIDLIKHEAPNERPSDWIRRRGYGGGRRPTGRSAPPIRSAVERATESDDRQRIEWAARVWRESVEPWGSPVETYLRTRGIALPADCDAIRFHPQAAFRLASGGLVHLPAMG